VKPLLQISDPSVRPPRSSPSVMKSAIAAVCIALVASVCAASDEAFVPSAGRLPTLRSRTSPARSQLEMATKTSAFDSEPGVLPPLGYFDPLNIFTDKDPEDAAYKKWRAIEIKHGRLAMLAVLGYSEQPGTHKSKATQSLPLSPSLSVWCLSSLCQSFPSTTSSPGCCPAL